MKKIILTTALLASGLTIFTANNSKAALFGHKGKLETLGTGVQCCRYALFKNECVRDWQNWPGCD